MGSLGEAETPDRKAMPVAMQAVSPRISNVAEVLEGKIEKADCLGGYFAKAARFVFPGTHAVCGRVNELRHGCLQL